MLPSCARGCAVVIWEIDPQNWGPADTCDRPIASQSQQTTRGDKDTSASV